MTDPESAFVERLGLVVEAKGLPRTAGRMIGFFLLTDGAHSLDDIADRLQVSKASVSTNARTLEQTGILERTSSPGDRRDYYRIAEDCWERMFEVARQRMQEMHRVLTEALASLPEDLEAGRARVREIQLFYGFMLDDLEAKVERWRSYLASEAGAGAGVAGGALSEGT